MYCQNTFIFILKPNFGNFQILSIFSSFH